MPTKPTFSDLEFTVVVDLTSVKGGCKGKKSCCQQQTTNIIQAPAPAPVMAAPAPRDEITTNVSMTGY